MPEKDKSPNDCILEGLRLISKSLFYKQEKRMELLQKIEEKDDGKSDAEKER